MIVGSAGSLGSELRTTTTGGVSSKAGSQSQGRMWCSIRLAKVSKTTYSPDLSLAREYDGRKTVPMSSCPQLLSRNDASFNLWIGLSATLLGVI